MKTFQNPYSEKIQSFLVRITEFETTYEVVVSDDQLQFLSSAFLEVHDVVGVLPYESLIS